MRTTSAAPVGQQQQASGQVTAPSTPQKGAQNMIALWTANLNVIQRDLGEYKSLKEKLPNQNHSTHLKNVIADRQKELAALTAYLKQNDVAHGLPIGTDHYATLADKRTTFEFQLNQLKKFKLNEDQKHFSYKPYAFAAASCMVVALGVLALYTGAFKNFV